MLRHAMIAAAATLLLIGGIGAARADDRAEIDALYAKLTSALKNLKPDETLALEAPGFTSTERSGKKVNGKQLAEEMRTENKDVKRVKHVSITVKDCKIKGKTAKVTTNFEFAIETVDKDGHMGKKGATHEMSVTGEVMNDLVKTSGGWKFLTMRNGASKMTLDGKPVDMSSGGGPKTTKKM